ncbi:MAG: MerR family transcriptional regulator [Gammaproteobacteria bacterium]
MQQDSRTGTTLTIGGLAREVGVGVETIRYYQRLGLLAEPPKSNNTRRRYSHDALVRLRLIRHAQALGFTLREIRTLLSLGEEQCTATRSIAERKLKAIDEQLATLNTARRSLERLIECCGRGEQDERCALFAALLEQSSNEP